MNPLERSIQLLNDGEVVAIPTETVYGLAACIDRIHALDHIFELKGRPSDNPLIVHVADISDLENITPAYSSPTLQKLAEAFWPGPLTLVVPRLPHIPDRVTAGLDTVAVRMPDHAMALDIIRKTGPLAAPSANISGRPSPTRAEHVRLDFGDAVLIVDGGACKKGIESTVLDISAEGSPAVLRPGSISGKEIEQVLNVPVLAATHAQSPKSPGTRYRHYSPVTPVFLYNDEPPQPGDLVIAPDHISENQQAAYYGYNGDYSLLASELYDRFRQADLESKRRIIVLQPQNTAHPLYEAILNRIEKAAGI